ncbi:MAG: arsenic resistance protein [Athalassotoga sp.]|uniref:arsenic resistance protein n=1 Tax=Athalassotoga sp. TaxID=2022597 RepID=UPI003D08F99C
MISLFESFAKNLKKYLIVYSIIALAVGWGLGIMYAPVAKDNTLIFKNLVTVFVFFMIYPMMVNLDLKEIPKMIRKPKAVGLSLIYNYAITPVIAFVLSYLFLHDAMLSLGFMLVMLMPVGSSSVGYTGIVKGSVETATIAQTISFLLIPVLTPLYLSFMTKGVAIPMMLILQSILLLIILPMILGILTRFAVIKFMGNNGLKKINSLLSTSTMLFMFGVIGLIFFMKGELLIQRWDILVDLSLVTLLYLGIMLPLTTFVDKKAGLSYKDHMGIVFLSTSKNNSTAVAIATMAFDPLVAIPAAVLPIFQMIILVVYIHLEKPIEKYFMKPKDEVLPLGENQKNEE